MGKKPNFSRFLCPVCFRLYASNTVDREYPMCSDCGSEAMDIEVVPLKQYFSQTLLKELLEQETEWRAAKGFYDSYKQEKLKRMAQVIKLKKEFDADPSARA